MNNFKFIKGQFITQDNADEVFAIWCGEEYETEDGKSVDYSLFAYCDPTNIVESKDSHGHVVYETDPILSVGIDGDECDYVICKEDIPLWRICTAAEINKILQFLAENGYKWVMETGELQKLKEGEKLIFDTTPSTASNIPIKHKITTLTKKWNRQRVSIIAMDGRRKTIMVKACNKYNSVNYPPRRSYGSYYGNYSRQHGLDLNKYYNVHNAYGYDDEDYWDSYCD